MVLCTCPRCGDPVTAPAAGRPEWRVRCPLCLEEYELREIMERLPPLLVLVNAHGGVEAEEALAGEADAAYSGGAAAPPAFQFDEAPAPARPQKGPPKPRPRAKPKKNAVVEIVKIVGGGVAGISLAILGLWWIGGQDPFQLGPHVGAYVPLIVPAKLRGGSPPPTDPAAQETSPSGAADDPGARDTSGGRPRPDPSATAQAEPPAEETGVRASGGTRPPSGLPPRPLPPGTAEETPPPGEGLTLPGPAPEFPEPVFPEPEAPTLPGPADPEIAAPLPLPVEPPFEPGPAPSDPIAVPAPVDPPPADPPSAEPQPPAPSPSATQPRAPSLPPASGADVAAAVEAALTSEQDLSAADGLTKEEKQALALAHFGNLSALGRCLAAVDRGDPDWPAAEAEAAVLVSGLARDPIVRRLLGVLGARRWSDQAAAEAGIGLAGVVRETAAGEGCLICQVELAANGSPVATVVLWDADPAAIAPGAEILVLGAVVPAPAENLPGFVGDAPTAVAAGVFFLPKPAS